MEESLSVFELALCEEVAIRCTYYDDWRTRAQLGYPDNFIFVAEAFSDDYKEFGFNKAWVNLAVDLFFCWVRETVPKFIETETPLLFIPGFVTQIARSLRKSSQQPWLTPKLFTPDVQAQHLILKMNVATEGFDKGIPYEWVGLGKQLFICWCAYGEPRN